MTPVIPASSLAMRCGGDSGRGSVLAAEADIGCGVMPLWQLLVAPVAEIAEQPGTPMAAPQPEGDPQQLMALLLSPPEMTPAVSTPALLVSGNTLPAAVLAESSRVTTGQMGITAALTMPVQPVAGEADLLSATQPRTPLKLATPQDALQASQMVQQQLQHASGASLISLQHPTVALAERSLAGEVLSDRPAVITLPDAPQQQAEALRKALSERLELQIDRRTQRATIRLDPPHLGKLDISLQMDSGKLQVQIQAGQPEVARMLHQISAEMRHSLSEQNGVPVSLQVSTSAGDGQQQKRHHGQPETAVANNHDEAAPEQRGTDGTILTMV